MTGGQGGVPGGGAVLVRVLGPVELRDGQGGFASIRQSLRRVLLAVLATAGGRVLSPEVLVDALWGEELSQQRERNLHSQVSGLRGELAGAELDGASRLVRLPGGYRLVVGDGDLDVTAFRQLARLGQDAARAGDIERGAALLRAALAFWRGPALADVAELSPRLTTVARDLEEQRLAALEKRLDCDLALGLHAEAVAELTGLHRQFPLREGIAGQLMLGLYRCARRGEALAVFDQTRRVLSDELGLDPGPELADLQGRILNDDPALAPPAATRARIADALSSAGAGIEALAGRSLTNLPAQVSSFVGRDVELAEVHELISKSRLLTLTGTGGVGKTRLAIECAAGMVGKFADGIWLADLAAIADAELVPSRVMESLGVRQSGDLAVLEALRYRLQSAELLLILDSCEHLLDACAELAGELLRSSPGLHLVATSREPFGVTGEVAYQVQPLALHSQAAGELASPDSPAVRLFLDRGSAVRGGTAAAAMPLAVVAQICQELDGLPLAIELAAARASALSVEDIAAHLSDKFRFLEFRRPAAVRRHQALTTAIAWSYELLTERERSVFRQLSVFAGGFGLDSVALVCCGEDQADALDMIDRLVSKSLVSVELTASGTRYRLLETIRGYAAGQLAEAGEAEDARARHAEYFLRLAERERDSAVLARELDNCRVAFEWSLGRPTEMAPRLAFALGSNWLARGLLEEGQAWLEAALGHSQADSRLRVGLLRQLGTVLAQSGDLRRARTVLSDGAHVAEAAGLPAEQARIAVHLADIDHEGSEREALSQCEVAATTLEDAGDLDGLAEAWLSIGKIRFFLGDCHGGAEALEYAAASAREAGNDQAELEAARWLATCWWMLPVPVSTAIEQTEQALQSATGDSWAEAEILAPLSLLYAHVGQFAEARSAITRAKAEYARSAARYRWAHCAIPAGHIELIAGDWAAAEEVLGEGCDAFRAMGERGFFASAVAMLGESAYVQGRFDEAERLTREAEIVAAADDIDAQARWRATRAKILARRGQADTALQLAEEAVGGASETTYAWLLAETLTARAEVEQLAGDNEQAAESMRRALALYEARQASALAKRLRTALASLSR